MYGAGQNHDHLLLLQKHTVFKKDTKCLSRTARIQRASADGSLLVSAAPGSAHGWSGRCSLLLRTTTADTTTGFNHPLSDPLCLPFPPASTPTSSYLSRTRLRQGCPQEFGAYIRPLPRNRLRSSPLKRRGIRARGFLHCRVVVMRSVRLITSRTGPTFSLMQRVLYLDVAKVKRIKACGQQHRRLLQRRRRVPQADESKEAVATRPLSCR